MQKHDFWPHQLAQGVRAQALKTTESGRFYLVADVEQLQAELEAETAECERLREALAKSECDHSVSGITGDVGYCCKCGKAIEQEALDVYSLAARYHDKWRDRDEFYWLARLMQEVGELSSSLVGDHPDTPEHELRQIASIVINWLGKRTKAALAGEGGNG